ncbi:MAG: hypothetical protein HOH33_12360 [Verrucomicrobia bacterium]|jgi:hypothetical protein|nr:hypothetical protein [Verrucomicrobiota bacterium]
MDNQSPNHSPQSGELNQLASLLTQFGCPADKTITLASQLDKRARQLAVEKSKSYEESLMHLLRLMRQGWAAKEKGVSES